MRVWILLVALCFPSALLAIGAPAPPPGTALAVVSRDAVLRSETHGAGVTTQTPFLIGSVSKPFTATAVLRLVEAGRLTFDDPVRRHLPWFRLADEDAAGRVTVRHLLTHTSGLAQWAIRTDRFDNTPEGLARSVRELATVAPQAPPGTTHRYSDANYAVLGAIVEAVSGQPFGEYLRDAVFAPLGMGRSAATASEASRIGVPPGHRYLFGRTRAFDRGYDQSGAPFGYVASTLDDLVRFAQANLTAAGLAELHTGRVDTGGGGRYGLGWREGTLDGTRIVWHAGATPGSFAQVILMPERGRAVVYLANAYSPALDGALAARAFALARDAAAPALAPDPLLRWSLGAAVLIAALLLVGVARAAVLVARPRGRARTAAWWVLGCAVLIGAVTLGVPAAMGADLRMALLWTPDLGAALVAVAVLAGVVALLRAVAATRLIRSRER
ncbi:hypothetical protein Val02_10670 [Virgisporangium aliadipatigenens]|uniref:Beta-lactamase-related domain-containing protein n=1 Tax=Virgisporangium aliadipatigenens TaxID=741659 RepID=A0A8J3YHS9_9ACTN|nr:serine hydrolase domain-containing protein [Virgisporangium aliadipatigenens]GIJ44181.1 hypothetical protein Val02_10670 [Virgisporangium aliadipatigenens]